jgi:hypothetical protein
MRPLKWLGRHFWKICLSTILLVIVVWQYEDWHGRTELASERALWTAEIGELRFPESRIVPDEANFFAAPVFEAMSRTRPSADAAYEKALSEMPHRKWLELHLPNIKMPVGVTSERYPCEATKPLDVASWAAEQTKAGEVRPEGLSDAAWLHASMPQDDTIDGLVAALARPETAVLPSTSERMEVARKMDSTASPPICAWSNGFEFVRSLMLRARIAGAAGDGQRAMELTEICLRFAEIGSDADGLVTLLVGLAWQGETMLQFQAVLESRSLNDAQLQRIAGRLQLLNEERGTHRGLEGEMHCMQAIGGKDVRNSSGLLALSFPEGWLNANKANSLKWWRYTMAPDVPGDDLVYFAKKMREGAPRVRQELSKFPTPRTLLAMIAIPGLSNLAQSALEDQTLRRQTQAAIGMERYHLRYGKFPASLSELVPSVLPDIPGDPWKPGTHVQLETNADGRGYAIICAGESKPLRMLTR